MDRSTVISLVGVTYQTDSIGQQVKTETTRDVYCNISSVSASEWFEGGRNGLNPQYRATMFRYDYEGELVAILNGVRYSVYRTYIGRNDTIELYLEKKAGTS